MAESITTPRPKGAPLIAGFTEEGEDLSPLNLASANVSPLGGDAAKAHSHGGGNSGAKEASRAGRLSSFNPEDFPTLTGREEDWRFTPLKRLKGLDKLELDGAAAPQVRVVTEEGQDVLVETAALDDPRVAFLAPEDRVAANAFKGAGQATIVTIPEGVTGVRAVVTLRGEGLTPSAQHLVVIAAPGSESTVVLDHVGTAVLSQNVEIDVQEGARLNMVSLQRWDDDAVHASDQQARIGKDAYLKHTAVSFGGDLVRVTPSARFAAPGGEAHLFGLYFADAGQHLEHRLFVDHAAPKCTSRVLYKGALQGHDAHAVWIGDVLIRKEAGGTDSFEANKNLVLTDGARADSVPNLEIETGAIDGAGHSSTTGRFDDEHLFYLMARGIDEKTARRLVVRGFLNEIIQKIGVESIEEQLYAAIEAELAQTEI
ncbi:Fe-S cluster assembly protein SufD [Galactobacter caseinivorans]|uniref:Fe-S cluster assembly protein SufD n=1 Tax=Galactobacter caseinivorans TaxID=2676123 RepID=A0A496PKP4_9MICC|nr:Fe-S cluster assembly protein SufD [Galactobacter caseinivorans]RKW71074.1 Fe-S cluster assembly protein SufD [Galactobacter caseinivorans]